MTDELAAAMTAAINKATKAASEAGQKVIEMRLLEISTALTDIASALEKDAKEDTKEDAKEGKGPDHMAALVSAIQAIKLSAPEVTVTPQVQAAAPTVNVDVSPTPVSNHNHITMPPAAVTIHERAPAKVIRVEFEYVGDRIYGAKITRE